MNNEVETFYRACHSIDSGTIPKFSAIAISRCRSIYPVNVSAAFLSRLFSVSMVASLEYRALNSISC